MLDEEQHIEQLKTIRRLNNEFAWKLCDYLNDCPCAITPQLIKEADPDKILPKDVLYLALLSGFCCINSETSASDKILEEKYLMHSINFLDANKYKQNPYLKNISFHNVKFGNWQLTHSKYKAYEAFICNDIKHCDDSYEIPQIGFFDEEFSFPVVQEAGREWMAVKPSEIESMREPIDIVGGNVITFGLGLGYYAYMTSQKTEVQRITIVEKDQNVIELFEKHILPQFEHKSKVEIIRADAFEYLQKEMPHKNFDYAFVDLWHDTADGLELYLKAKKLERLAPQTKFLYWVEESLLSSFRWQNFDEIIEKSSSIEEALRMLSDDNLRILAEKIK